MAVIFSLLTSGFLEVFRAANTRRFCWDHAARFVGVLYTAQLSARYRRCLRDLTYPLITIIGTNLTQRRMSKSKPIRDLARRRKTRFR